MKGFLLTLLAIVLFAIIAPFAFIWQLIRDIKRINKYFFSIAISLDQFSNVFCHKLLDDVMIKKGGHLCGNTDETISSVIGRNKHSETLTSTGIILYHLLNSIQNNHSENAIEETDPKEDI